MTGRSSKGTVAPRFYLDPYFACLIWGGVGLSTWSLPTCIRLAVIWTTLLLLWLVFRERRGVALDFTWIELARGVGIGLAIGLPLLFVAYRPLMTAVPLLYIGASTSWTVLSAAEQAVAAEADIVGAMAFVSLVLLAPLAEELFFRDVLHRERGFLVGSGLYAAAGLLWFLPATGRFWAVLLAVSGVTAALGALYGFLFERRGLAVAIAAHVTINLTLLFIPVVLHILIGSQASL